MSETTGSPDYKFVVLPSKKLEPGVTLNATAHMAAALMDKATPAERAHMKFLGYPDADGEVHPVSGLSLIVLRADNSNKIRTARERAQESNTLYVDFTESMTGGTYVEQMSRTRSLAGSELEYYGLGMFGIKEQIDAITAKFLLWRCQNRRIDITLPIP